MSIEADELDEIREIFFAEADEHLEEMEAALLQFDNDPSDLDLLNVIFRGAHSIKGVSASFEFHAIASFTHVLENLLDRMREGTVAPNQQNVGVIFESIDTLSDLLDAEKEGSDPPQAMDEMLLKIKQETECEQTNETAEKNDSVNVRSQQEELSPSELENVSVGESNAPSTEDASESKKLNRQIPAPDPCGNASVSVSTIEVAGPSQELNHDSQEKKVGDEATNSDLPKPVPKPKKTGVAETVRVDRDRLDRLINQIGEIVIGTSMVEQDWKDLPLIESSDSLTHLAKIVRDLQEMSLSLRMVPIAATFQRMARTVRDLSSKLGKTIQLVTIGEETELDKTVVDKIGDPLLHMIRNSVDHGIEASEDRIAVGKPAEGKVTLSAFHEDGSIFIEISDDGKGLDLDRIRNKAIANGIISETDVLTRQETCDLIFHAGLSTADSVSDVSGRGVGMDVVRKNVEALNGRVTLDTIPGKGSTVRVQLPLTLAILDGLLIRLGNDVYIIPLLSVVESFRPKPDEVVKLANKTEVVKFRGEVVPVIRLNSVFNCGSCDSNPSQGLLVIVEDHKKKCALFVDDLLGQQQIVIKNLETNFKKVAGIAGATILGDGNVALILDIAGLRSLSLTKAETNHESAIAANEQLKPIIGG